MGTPQDTCDHNLFRRHFGAMNGVTRRTPEPMFFLDQWATGRSMNADCDADKR